MLGFAHENKLKIATHDYDQIQALKSGLVTIAGAATSYETRQIVTEIFQPMIVDHAFDIAELGFTYYLRLLDAGDTSLVALPVFLARVFRHSAIYVNKASVTSPADLVGKTIGELAVYGHDAGLWAKGLLMDEHGFRPEANTWIVGGLDFPMEPVEYIPQNHPADVEVMRADKGQDLGAMLESGEIDALISADVPRCVIEGSSRVGRLFPDWEAVEQDYHRHTGILPIMHVAVMRRELAVANADLPRAIFDAFCQSKAAAADTYVKGRPFNHLDVMLPWFSAHYDRVRAMFGEDWWPYGVSANCRAIEAVLRYHAEQGLTSRLLRVDEVFALDLVDS